MELSQNSATGDAMPAHSDGRAARGVLGRRRWRRWFALRRGLRWRCLLLGRRRGGRWCVLDRLDGPRHELGRSVGEGLVQRSGRCSSVGSSRRRCGMKRLRRDDLAARSEDLCLEFELAMGLGAGDEREAPDVEHKLVGRLESIARPAHGARIAGILEALDELLLEQDRNVVTPPRIRNVGALSAVGRTHLDLVRVEREQRRGLRHHELPGTALRPGAESPSPR